MKSIVKAFVIFVSIALFSLKAENTLFQAKLENYINLARVASKQNINEETEKSLVDSTTNIISLLTDNFIKGKLKTEKIVLKYSKDRDLPNLNDFEQNIDKQIANFIFSAYIIFSNLNNDIIHQIIRKSPLEMVSLLKEFQTFLEFCTVDAQTYGNPVILEKEQDGSVTIYASAETIKRVAKPIVMKNLLRRYDGNIYALSRINSEIGENFSVETIAQFIDSMKRNTADNSRKRIYSTILMNTFSDLNSQSKKDQYLEYISKLAKQQEVNRKIEIEQEALKMAMDLIGVKPNCKLVIFDTLDKFCQDFDKATDNLRKNIKNSDGKTKLRINRDIENYEECAKFLRASSKILEAFIHDISLLLVVIQKDPYSILSIAKETIIMLQVLKSILEKTATIDDVIKSIKGFIDQTDDGSYLMSTLLSRAMEDGKSNIKNLIESTDFSDKSQNKFLRVR